MGNINRKTLVSRHNPVLREINTESPLSVGNGSFAFTADITGLQTLSAHYEKQLFPLCSMSEWGWHSHPGKPGKGELQLTPYQSKHRKVRYAVRKFSGNERVYDWLRQNPHRLNLARVRLTMNGQEIDPSRITEIRQELRLYEGLLESRFCLDGSDLVVHTACSAHSDTLAFSVQTDNGRTQLPEGIAIEISFPYGSCGISASDWEHTDAHQTVSTVIGKEHIHVNRYLDGDTWSLSILAEGTFFFPHDRNHSLTINPAPEMTSLSCSFHFSPGMDFVVPASPYSVIEDSRMWWMNYWETGGAIDFSGEKDSRARELERRIVLSQYLLAVNSAGSMPPAETGLTCNSWYGKFHLEMHPLHALWMPLWGHTDLLERSLLWYRNHLDRARENAFKNGYHGARWPKMVGPEGIDAPSSIATLLVWQQGHIIHLLDAVRKTGKDRLFLLEWRETVYETARFMADFAEYDPRMRTWNLEAPLIPVQEEYNPESVRNPAFENAYWSSSLEIASRWLLALGEEPPSLWKEVADGMAKPETDALVYTACADCPETFTRYNRDHPSMLMMLGYLKGKNIDCETMKRTLKKVLNVWDFQTLWGWDFAMMAMTAYELGDYALMIDILLKDTPKNYYAPSGNNYQKTRDDLPLYLPGNGSLLLAVGSCLKGFAKIWTVKYEGILPLHGETDDR